MVDINEFIIEWNKETHRTESISLSGKLEALIGHYFVWGESGAEACWLIVYYDPKTDLHEAVALKQENIVAYVTSDYRWTFVLESHAEKFRKDTAGYGMTLIPITSFSEEILCCSNTGLLPKTFGNVEWIDDDFMNDENIPFDYDSFEKIDSGIPYLNPRHFSVKDLVFMMNEL